jgi:hypothetical protein
MLEPAVERGSEDRVGFLLGCDFEQRIDSRLDWAFLKQVAAKRVNGADARLFELFQGLVETVPFGAVARIAAAILDSLAHPEFEFARGFFRKRHRDNFVESSSAGGDYGNYPAHQLSGFTGPRRRFDDHRDVEIAMDSVARTLIG